MFIELHHLLDGRAALNVIDPVAPGDMDELHKIGNI